MIIWLITRGYEVSDHKMIMCENDPKSDFRVSKKIICSFQKLCLIDLLFICTWSFILINAQVNRRRKSCTPSMSWHPLLIQRFVGVGESDETCMYADFASILTWIWYLTHPLLTSQKPAQDPVFANTRWGGILCSCFVSLTLQMDSLRQIKSTF